MNRQELAKTIFQTAHLTGKFLLRSGQTSSEYFDKYRFESNPRILNAIAEHMLQLIPTDVDFLAGLEMGGIPIATALSLRSGIPSIFVRKEAKNYGTCQFAEGVESVKGKTLCIIEDVVTTGGQVVLSTNDLRSNGAIVTNVLCVIHRGGGKEPLAKAGLELSALFEMQELKNG